jgi:2-succinyl-5-enolpyruvyl-6-hydroxy-3-cyclohexene-1-carboxylate synthase
MGVFVTVAVLTGTAVAALFPALVAAAAAGGSVAIMTAAVLGALVGALAVVAGVKLHARMETNRTAIPNQVVKKRNDLRFISSPPQCFYQNNSGAQPYTLKLRFPIIFG